MSKKTRQPRVFRDFHIDELKDTENARIYLEVARAEYKKDHDRKAFLKAIEDVAEAQGGLRDRRVEDIIDLESLESLFHNLGFRLSIELEALK